MNGVIVNAVAVLAGTFAALLFGGIIPNRLRATAFSGIGLATTVIGPVMAIGGLTDLAGSRLGAYAPLVLVGSFVPGAMVGSERKNWSSDHRPNCRRPSNRIVRYRCMAVLITDRPHV